MIHHPKSSRRTASVHSSIEQAPAEAQPHRDSFTWSARSPPAKVCYSCCAQHASSSSCRRLQEATCRAKKTLLDCRTSGDEQTNRPHAEGPDRTEQNRPPSGPPGVNPRGLAGLCQPSLPPGHLLAVPTAALPVLSGPSACRPCFLATFQDREAGRCQPRELSGTTCTYQAEVLGAVL